MAGTHIAFEQHRVFTRIVFPYFCHPLCHVWERSTRQRATLEAGTLTHHLPASYHGMPGAGKSDFLVFYEFGADFVERCTEAGFELELVRHAHNPAVVTFIARKPA